MSKPLLFLALVLFSALAGAADPVKSWHGALIEDPPGFDPAGHSSSSSTAITELIFDTLLTYDYLARPAKLVPKAAAAMPVVTDGGRTWTVSLRKGIYFAPDAAFKGVRRELVARDVAYTIMRFMDPERHAPYQFMFRNKLVGLDNLALKAKDKNGKLDYDAHIRPRGGRPLHAPLGLGRPDIGSAAPAAHGAAGIVAREVVEATATTSATTRWAPARTG